jgi:hypothetical protein
MKYGLNNKTKKHISGIIFRHTQRQNIGKLNNLKLLGARKPKGINNIAKIS